ncbi:MAG: hypothetical protein ACREA2_22775 [Blastocatellia bacterium]
MDDIDCRTPQEQAGWLGEYSKDLRDLYERGAEVKGDTLIIPAEVMKICEETGRKPAEVLRDAIDEWLLMRRAAATGATAAPPDNRESDIGAKIDSICLS